MGHGGVLLTLESKTPLSYRWELAEEGPIQSVIRRPADLRETPTKVGRDGVIRERRSRRDQSAQLTQKRLLKLPQAANALVVVFRLSWNSLKRKSLSYSCYGAGDRDRTGDIQLGKMAEN
jgi:hypothetical protein